MPGVRATPSPLPLTPRPPLPRRKAWGEGEPPASQEFTQPTAPHPLLPAPLSPQVGEGWRSRGEGMPITASSIIQGWRSRGEGSYKAIQAAGVRTTPPPLPSPKRMGRGHLPKTRRSEGDTPVGSAGCAGGRMPGSLPGSSTFVGPCMRCARAQTRWRRVLRSVKWLVWVRRGAFGTGYTVAFGKGHRACSRSSPCWRTPPLASCAAC